MVEMRNLFGTIARSTSAPAGYDQIDDTSEGRLKERGANLDHFHIMLKRVAVI